MTQGNESQGIAQGSTTQQIEVTFTWQQVRAMQFDAIDELTLVRSSKSTMTYKAPRPIWERELRMAGGSATAGSEWTPGYARSAGSAAGRIARALNAAPVAQGPSDADVQTALNQLAKELPAVLAHVVAESAPVKQHPFERSGLGVAPFRCIGVERRVGPIKYPNGVEVGAPGQPMGTCAHCGNGIAECCIIQDANGKQFIVGNQCVMKVLRADNVADTADRALRRSHAQALAEARRKREQEDSAALNNRLANDAALRATLAALPHPTFGGKTLLDWATWMMQHAGAAGRTKVRRAIANVEGGVS